MYYLNKFLSLISIHGATLISLTFLLPMTTQYFLNYATSIFLKQSQKWYKNNVISFSFFLSCILWRFCTIDTCTKYLYGWLSFIPSELGKRERERLVHSFTHERGSFLAHIFLNSKFMNVSDRGSLFCLSSFQVHFTFLSAHLGAKNKHQNSEPFKLFII